MTDGLHLADDDSNLISLSLEIKEKFYGMTFEQIEKLLGILVAFFVYKVNRQFNVSTERTLEHFIEHVSSTLYSVLKELKELHID